MEPLLAFASDLEERDARIADELARVEAEQAEVEELRTHAARLGELLAWLPQAASENEYALHQATRRREDAAASLRDAEDEQKPAAEAALAAAEADVARLEEHRRAFERRSGEAQAEVAALAGGVGTAGLDDTLETLSQRRGALLVEHSSLVRDRDAVVREASELLGSVLGDPLASTSVSGLRERLQRALA
jgi:chromosome segregation ATPase